MAQKVEIPENAPRILVVDDEPAFTRMVKLSLEANMEYMVKQVNRSAEALSVAREFKPQLILLDVVMPEADGGDVASKFRADPALGDVPIVFVSAMVSRRESHGDMYVSGGERFLAKPVGAEDLKHCVQRTLRE